MVSTFSEIAQVDDNNLEKIENTNEINPKIYEEPCDYMFMTSRSKFPTEFCRELGKYFSRHCTLPMLLPLLKYLLPVIRIFF